jgi:hypothetical protein
MSVIIIFYLNITRLKSFFYPNLSLFNSVLIVLFLLILMFLFVLHFLFRIMKINYCLFFLHLIFYCSF